MDIFRVKFMKQRVDSDKNDFRKTNWKNITLLYEKLIKNLS